MTEQARELQPSWEYFNLPEAQYEDIVSPYKRIIKYMVENTVGTKVVIKSGEEIPQELQEIANNLNIQLIKQ